MVVFHVTIATRDRAPLALDTLELLRLVRVVARVAGAHALLFCVVDDHLHLVVESSAIGYLAGGLVRAVRRCVDREVAPPHIRRVEGRKHLESLVRYVLTQPEHHELSCGNHLWPGSCFQDLVGARIAMGYSGEALWRWLPRYDVASVCHVVGVDVPTPQEQLAPFTLLQLQEAASHAVAAPLSGQTALACAGRGAVAKLAQQAGYGLSEIARQLQRHTATTRRLAKRCDVAVAHAVRLRLSLTTLTGVP